MREWLGRHSHFPERFEAMNQCELAEPGEGGALATHAMCLEGRNTIKYPLPLSQIERSLLEEHYERQMQAIIEGNEYKDDRVHCYCAYA